MRVEINKAVTIQSLEVELFKLKEEILKLKEEINREKKLNESVEK